MTMHKKLQESMREGVILERDRCMRILFRMAKETKQSLDKKLMNAGEKHLAEIRFKIAEGIIAVAQMQIMNGVDPDAKATLQVHRPDSSPVGQAQRHPHGASRPCLPALALPPEVDPRLA